MSFRRRHPLFVFILAIFLIAAIFYILAVPALVAAHRINPSWITGTIALLLYSQIWLFVADLAYRSVAHLYGFRVRDIWSVYRFIRHLVHAPENRFSIVIYGTISYAFTIYGFAIGYLFLSMWSNQAFNVGKLSFFDSIYFSVVTITTVGYGDIVPLSKLARLLVMAEIMTGLTYVVFIFSLIGRYAQVGGCESEEK